jgi:hypothetical protein
VKKGNKGMLKHVTKPDGKPITIPASFNEANLEQQGKRGTKIWQIRISLLLAPYLICRSERTSGSLPFPQ